MSLQTEALAEKIGTRILASKDQLLSGEHSQQIRELLESRGVLVFPEIHFDDDEQVAFTKTLGKFAPERVMGGGAPDPGESVHPISLDVETNPSADYLLGSMYWHIDGTMNDLPILASLLSAKVLSKEGGETHFCNTYASWDELPDEDKAEYDGLRVMHSAWNSLFYYDPEPDIRKLDAMMNIGDAELPLVWKHQSGRKSLILGCTAYEVVGKSIKESRRILHKLLSWATQDAFVYRHQWTVGDLVMWDNTGTMHRATAYDPASGRRLHRTKLQGEEPFE